MLKRDLPALMGHLKIGAQDRIGGAAEQGGRSVMALQRQMQEQPLLFLLGAYRGGIPRRARADA